MTLHPLYYLIFFVTLFSMPSAYAACTASSSTSTFGTISSFTLTNNAQTVKSGTGFVCSGSLLSLLGTNTATASITSTTHSNGAVAQLYNAQSGHYIPYTLCQDSACSTPYNIGGTITWSSTTLLGLLGLFNSSDGSLPLYLHTATGINVPAGTYTDTITLNWTYHICFVGVFGACIYTDGIGTSTINVTMNVSNDCYIDNAPNINFGTAALPSEFKTISNILRVRCSLNASYSVNFTSTNPIMNGWRQMQAKIDGKNYQLQYQIYKPDGSLWNDNNNYTALGNGVSQAINYTATINQKQPNQPSGSYSDVVIVTVTY